jgi:hypothetical protein
VFVVDGGQACGPVPLPLIRVGFRDALSAVRVPAMMRARRLEPSYSCSVTARPPLSPGYSVRINRPSSLKRLTIFQSEPSGLRCSCFASAPSAGTRASCCHRSSRPRRTQCRPGASTRSVPADTFLQGAEFPCLPLVHCAYCRSPTSGGASRRRRARRRSSLTAALPGPTFAFSAGATTCSSCRTP